jgi:two-component system, OmpR family, sensor histidine kinase KdpD
MLVAMSSDPATTAALIRRASRAAGRLNSDWYCVYVQTRAEQPDRIDSAVQRKLVDNIQLAQGLGAEVTTVEGEDIAREIIRFAREKGISLVVIGQSHHTWWHRMLHGSVTDRIAQNADGLDVLIVAVPRNGKSP